MANDVSVPGAKTTQPFGIAVAAVAALEPAMWATAEKAYWRRYPGATFHQHFHPGIDRAAGLGTEIRAIQAGRVIFAGWRNEVSGNVVRVEIRPGTRYGFSHCSEILVEAGTAVVQGQLIAKIGKTGVAKGFHTHSFVSILEDGGDGVMRNFLYNPTLFEPNGPHENDIRVAPLDPGPRRLVTLLGPGINIRTSPDLDEGDSNVFASSRAGGIFRGARRIHANVFSPFILLRELTDDNEAWVEVIGFNRVLYIHRSMVKIH